MAHVPRPTRLLTSRSPSLYYRYRPWVAIGLHEGSLDDLVDACATEAADFEANFKVLRAKRKEASRDHPTPHTPPLPPQVLKAKRKEAEKLPATEKVDCITVNLAPFKAAVDDQQQRLTDALLYGMRRLSDTKKAEVDEFIAASMETLSRRPQSVDEIGTAKKEWREIVQNKEGVKGTLKKLEELGRQMRGVSKHGIELGPIMSKWEELELTPGRAHHNHTPHRATPTLHRATPPSPQVGGARAHPRRLQREGGGADVAFARPGRTLPPSTPTPLTPHTPQPTRHQPSP